MDKAVKGKLKLTMKIARQLLPYLYILIVIYIILGVANIYREYGPTYRPFAIPIQLYFRGLNSKFAIANFLEAVIPLAGFAAIFRLWWSMHSRHFRYRDFRSQLRRTAHTILNSDEFATALRPTLPKGADDQKYGFDYIPFLLKNIDDRRIRFANSSRFFLASTIILAVTFSMILAALGYILVDESATGDAYRLRDISNNVALIHQQIPNLTRNLEENTSYRNKVKPIIDRISEFKAGGDSIITSIQSAIVADVQNANVGKLETSVTDWTSKEAINNKDFLDLLKNLQGGIKEFEQVHDDAGYFVLQSIDGLKDNIASATKTVDSNRTNELLKRLAIGLIIASFFFAILKYMAGLYRDHHSQMVQAEQDDMAIRRFYIAFRCATNDPYQRAHVLGSFVASQNGKSAEKESDKDFTPQTQDLVKDILTAIAKRAGA